MTNFEKRCTALIIREDMEKIFTDVGLISRLYENAITEVTSEMGSKFLNNQIKSLFEFYETKRDQS